MPNSLDPDQDRPTVGPDLGPNCLQRFLVDYKSTLARKELYHNNSDILDDKNIKEHEIAIRCQCLTLFACYVIFYDCFFFFSSADFFKRYFFQRFFHEHYESLDPDQARRNRGLIWVQTVCKSYQ